MEPEVRLRQIATDRDGAAGRWLVRWQIDNLGTDALSIDSVRVPHGQFKADEQPFTPPLFLAAGGSAEFGSSVRCDEPVGLVTENAFVILHCRWRGEGWRIFVRICVTVTAGGIPETSVESITTQQVGFSGISN